MFSRQKQGSVLTDGGSLKIVHIAILSLVIVFYLATYMTGAQPLAKMLIGSVPFIIMILVVLVLDSKPANAFVFLVLAIGTTIDPANISDYSGAVFFIFSFHEIKKKWYALFLSVVTITCLTIRSIEANDNIPGALIMLAVFGYIYAIYYFLIYKTSNKQVKSKIPLLSKHENDLISDLVAGLSQKEAIANRGYSRSQGYDMFRNIKRKMECESIISIACSQVEYNHSKSIFKK